MRRRVRALCPRRQATTVPPTARTPRPRHRRTTVRQCVLRTVRPWPQSAAGLSRLVRVVRSPRPGRARLGLVVWIVPTRPGTVVRRGLPVWIGRSRVGRTGRRGSGRRGGVGRRRLVRGVMAVRRRARLGRRGRRRCGRHFPLCPNASTPPALRRLNPSTCRTFVTPVRAGPGGLLTPPRGPTPVCRNLALPRLAGRSPTPRVSAPCRPISRAVSDSVPWIAPPATRDSDWSTKKANNPSNRSSVCRRRPVTLIVVGLGAGWSGRRNVGGGGGATGRPKTDRARFLVGRTTAEPKRRGRGRTEVPGRSSCADRLVRKRDVTRLRTRPLG